MPTQWLAKHVDEQVPLPKLVQVTSVSRSRWCQLPELANAMLGGRCLDLPNSGPTFQGGRYDRVIVVVSTALPVASKTQ